MYCTENDVTQYLLADYITAVETKTPGVTAEHIARVSEQIDAYIGERYTLPLPTVPAILNWVAAVMAAYRVLGSLTSLVRTEAASENEFLYLQGEYKRAGRTLEDIRDGKIALFPGTDDKVRQDDTTFHVATPVRKFTDDLLGRY